MERTMSTEERIKRAEEIYARRRNQGIRVSTTNMNVKETKKSKVIKKMILQILICFVLYSIIYLVQENNFTFSGEILEKAKQFLSYDMNFQKIYEKTNAYFSNNSNAKETIELNGIINGVETIKQKQSGNTQVVGGMGGGTEVEEQQTTPVVAQTDNLTQEEIDVKYIKETVSMIKPLNGTVTSRYGPRTPTDIISANHAGIDIGAKTGTDIIAAMEGTVTQVSSQGDYRKSLTHS